MHVLQLQERLRTGYWFIPGLMSVAGVVLAECMLSLDREGVGGGSWLSRWLNAGGVEGSRAVLSTVAGSMITVGATVFSIMMLTLSMASQQFGPRMLRNFMRDRWNQAALGAFMATFLYSLLVLRSIGGGGAATGQSVAAPALSVSVGLALVVVAAGVLIAFIHHVSVQIQAPQVIAMVARELDAQIDEFFPEEVGREGGPSSPMPEICGQPGREVNFIGTGYIEVLDLPEVMRVAVEHDLIVRLEVRVGRYVIKGQPCASVWPAERVTESVAAQIAQAYALSVRRTPAQDPEFAVRQLVEIAARALSPALNDPFTAVACVEHLTAAVVKMAQRKIPSPFRADEKGVVRVIAPHPTFGELLHLGFEPIRQYGAAHPLVINRVLDALATIAGALTRREDRPVVLEELGRVDSSIQRHLAEDPQFGHLRTRVAKIAQALRTGDESPETSSGVGRDAEVG
ncbi:MAG TPA: DUF2254 domain-containing protein [Phycisphaerales bacterium]|nr:DUF2254 domain-containing protein [Phycisphaerales bacterium]